MEKTIITKLKLNSKIKKQSGRKNANNVKERTNEREEMESVNKLNNWKSECRSERIKKQQPTTAA